MSPLKGDFKNIFLSISQNLTKMELSPSCCKVLNYKMNNSMKLNKVLVSTDTVSIKN